MPQLIAGNWKMHGLGRAAAGLAESLRRQARGLDCDLLVCPPFIRLAAVADIMAGGPIGVGGQDCHWSAQAEGAHTGDISAAMLRDAGATWVIVGHSERRANHGETDALVCAKAQAATSCGLTPIVCVGETEADRLAGRHETVVAAQVAGSLPAGFDGVVAYEPAWAIGSGRVPTDADIVAMHGLIAGLLRQRLGPSAHAIRILYGGSVKPENAAALLALPGVGGALIGGASLHADEFLAIARAATPGPPASLAAAPALEAARPAGLADRDAR